jgi:hypothetical protein
MISQKLLKEYDLNTVNDNYSMVVESRLNGNFEQAKKQFKRIELSKRLEFITHCKNLTNDKRAIEFFQNILFIK